MSRCPGHGRHWYTVHGAVGLRSPVCVRCGDPNPRPLSEDEWAELTGFAALEAKAGYPLGGAIGQAIAARAEP